MTHTIQISDLLNEYEQKIEHIQGLQQRATALLDLFSAKQFNSSTININAAIRLGVKEMVDAMNKIEANHEINLCVSILDHYIETGSFILFVVPPSKSDKKTTMKFSILRERLREIVIKYEPNFD